MYIYFAYICIYVSVILISSKQVSVCPYTLIFLSIKVLYFDNMFVCALCHITDASNARDIASIGLIFLAHCQCSLDSYRGDKINLNSFVYPNPST